MAWYYLDKRNRVCGPVDYLTDPRVRVGWDDRSELRHLDHAQQGHGVRPCGWERVAFTEVAEGCTVSTVFLGLDYGFGSRVPIVFETLANWGFDYMLPPSPPDETPDSMAAIKLYRELWECQKDIPIPQEWDMDRYATWTQAERGHEAMVAKMRAAIAEREAQSAAIWNEALANVADH